MNCNISSDLSDIDKGDLDFLLSEIFSFLIFKNGLYYT
jgi:hypothetical protein